MVVMRPGSDQTVPTVAATTLPGSEAIFDSMLEQTPWQPP
jgi:hypothetical protein